MKTKIKLLITPLLLLTLMSFAVSAAPIDDFVITIKSDNASTLPTEFTIPTSPFITGYNYSVDCNNDGINEATGVTGDYTCDYAALGAGTYTIRIKDSSGGSGGTDFPAILFNNIAVSRGKIISIDQWGTGVWTSMTSAFFGTHNMDIIAIDAPNLSNVTTTHGMFQNNTSLVGVSANWNWNVSNVTNMDNMFFNASAFDQDIGNWDVSNVLGMDNMFRQASAFDQDISAWDVTNVTNFEDFLTGAELSHANYDALLTAWDILDLTDSLVFDAGNSQFCNAVIAKFDIMTNDDWTINDGGLAANCPLSSASIITVGPVGSSCNITTGSTKIQDAIDFGPNTIRLVNTEAYNENIIIDDIDITITGGYASCADAVNGIRNPDDKSIINGSTNNFSTIRIFGSSFFNDVELIGLEITGGTSNTLGGGGIVAFAADVQIILRNVLIHSNTGRFGGGIGMIVSDRTNLFAIDTVVRSNQADDGGGLYCNYTGSGVPPQIIFNKNTGISDNSADGQGGGVFLNTCDLFFASGDEDIALDIGINRNTSTAQGGGIYAEDGAIIDLIGDEDGCGFICQGDNTKPVTIAGNIAQGNGGGIFLTDFSTQLDMNMVLLSDNTTDANGGGIAVESDAVVNVTRSQKECWDESHCNFFTGNKSGESAGLGGLIYNNSAIANINQTEIAFNRADFGTVLYGIGAGSITRFNGSVIRDNGGIRFGAFPHDDSYVFRVANNAQVDVNHSTIADNVAAIAVFGIATNSANTSDIVNSIIHDASTGDVHDSDGLPRAFFTNCIVHEDASLNLISLNVMVDDPLFVNPAGNDYHIDPLNSPAIDFTNSGFTPPDMDFETRGIDRPEIMDFLGPYDVGADEAYKPDAMFSDGFEN